MKFVKTSDTKLHEPVFFVSRGQLTRSPERAERADMLSAAAERAGLEAVTADPPDLAEVAYVHDSGYLDFLNIASQRWRELGHAGPEVVANMHPNRVDARRPRSIVGLAGWYMADAACPIGPSTFAVACNSASAASTGASRLLSGEPAIYALCRPPGHHAFADMAGGFCFLNNTAIAAEKLARAGRRVAVLDIDVHHGNGTQAIFYDRDDVLTLSIHADPADYYPFYWGYADETGAGAGNGANVNIPLPVGAEDGPWLDALSHALGLIDGRGRDTLVVALGLDARADDPLEGMRISPRGFERAGGLIGEAGMPTLLVQEGGYPSQSLGSTLEAFLGGFLSSAR